MYITDDLVTRYGRTDGCEGCATRASGMRKAPHSQKCRERILEAMDGDEEGRRRTQAHEDRLNYRMAVYLEQEEQTRIKREETPGMIVQDEEEDRQAIALAGESEIMENDTAQEAAGMVIYCLRTLKIRRIRMFMDKESEGRDSLLIVAPTSGREQ